jgi:tRNA-Thr(GGU) m(6)t(6)A37 methyltransferase TsaA
MEISMKAIGIIHTPFTKKTETPIQSARSTAQGTIEVFSEYLEGLDGIDEFSHAYLIYGWNQAEPCTNLLVKPFLDDQVHGVFATRYPVRPNPVGLSIVKLVERKNGIITFLGADMLDGTPLWDIKPYIPEFDIFEVEKIGWYKKRKFD